METLIEEQKKNYWHRYHTITNVILVIVIIAIGFYIYSNLQDLKTLSGDVCRLCEVKTGGVCQTVTPENSFAKNQIVINRTKALEDAFANYSAFLEANQAQ